jgi:thymidylate kinase
MIACGNNINTDRKALIGFIENLEYNLLQLPRPDLVLLLDVDYDVATKQIEKKEERDYLKGVNTSKDNYEASTTLQTLVKQEYLTLAKESPQVWSVIETSDKTIEQIHEKIQSIFCNKM